jgi:four helix bundle protein
MSDQIRSYKDLRVYRNAMEAAMEIFELTKSFPAEERYSLVDQFRRASRSVCANIAEGWRKRRQGSLYCQMERCRGRGFGDSSVDLVFTTE